jgi:hypothetical protein
MFKYLVNLGADPNVKDVEGNTAGIYLRNRDLLPHQTLLDAKEEEGSGGAGGSVERWERPVTPPGKPLPLISFSLSPPSLVEIQKPKTWV